MGKLPSDLLYNDLLINLIKELINLELLKNYEEGAVALNISRPSLDKYIWSKNRVSAKKYALYLDRLLDYLNEKTKKYQLLNDRIVEMKIKLEIEKQKFLPNH